MSNHPPQKRFQDVLVLSVRKNFWASKECEIFPNRLYARTLMPGPGRFGSSRNPVNVLTLALNGYFYYRARKPRVILFGAAPRVSAWFAKLKKRGLLPDVKLLAAGALYLDDQLSHYMDKMYVYSRGEISLHAPELRDKYVFISLPADGDFNALPRRDPGKYIFAGGGAGRDFPSLIEAMRDLDQQLEIVTFSPETLGYQGQPPENCNVSWRVPRQEFLERMAGASFVVAPLVEGLHPHGHTTLVQAQRLGKAVITTRSASVDDYVIHGREGLLVSPGDVAGYRQAILKMSQDHELRAACEQHAMARAPELTYTAFANRLTQLCLELLQ